jgi:hypothetical protein
LTRDAGHEERREEDGEYRQHREETGHGGFAGRVDDGAGAAEAFGHVGMDVFDFDGGFIDEHADGEGEAAEGHDIQGLAKGPEADDRSEQRDGDGGDDDETAAPVAQEEQDHQGG